MGDVRRLKEKATEAFQKGKFSKAAEFYAEYCEADPKDLQARLRMGDAWSKGGKKDKAIEAYTSAAEGFAKDGFLPRAIAASKLILELDPSHKGVQKMLADLYARKTTGPAAGPSRPMRIETRIEVQTTAVGFANRKDAIELDAKPQAAPKRPVAKAEEPPPSPMNRADAIELPAYEVPGMEPASVSGSASVPMAARGPSPTRRADAIEIEVEETGRRGPAALSATTLDLDVSVTGAQVPRPGDVVPAPRPSGPHLEIEVEVPIEGVELQPAPAASEGFELEVLPPAPSPESFELEVKGAPSAPSPESFELEVKVAPSAPSPAPAPAPVAPEAKVWDLLEDEPLEELDVIETVVSEELELVDVAESELLPTVEPAVPQPPKPALDVLSAPSAVPQPAPAKPALEVLSAPAAIPLPASELVGAATAPPPDLVAAPAAVPFPPPAPARPQLEVLAAEPAAVARSAPSVRAAAEGEKSGSFSAPPGLKPRRPAQDAPALPPEATAPPRIWLPGNFAPPAGAAPPPAPQPGPDAPPAPPAAPPTQELTDLERGLQFFASFDAEDFRPTRPPPPAPVAALPIPAPPSAAAPSRRTFTELELEGDSLLHAVEAAAAVGVEQRGEGAAQPEDEATELPDDQKLEPGELPKIPLFSDLPPDAFIALFERCPLKRVEPGEVVIQQGSLGDSFYVICAGSVRVFRMDGEQRREIATLEEGTFFGEMALLSGAARAASVEAATEDTQLLEISAPILTELSHRYPQVATALKKFCRQRLLSNLMSSSTLFQPFSRQDRRDLVQRFRARDVAKGEVLIKEGHRSDGMYVILSGEVTVRVGATQVASLKEGDVFGEMSLLTKANATATVAASKHTSLLRLPREDFDLIIMSHPQVLVLVSELTDARAKQNAALASHRPPKGDEAPMV